MVNKENIIFTMFTRLKSFFCIVKSELMMLIHILSSPGLNGTVD